MGRLDWPRYEARTIVRVQLPHSLFDLCENGGPALANQHDFGRGLYLAFPTVHRMHSSNYVDTGGEPFLDQRVSNDVGHFERWRSDIEGQVLAHRKQGYRKPFAV